ncbi:putative multidrug resistance protein E [Trypanosoma cruzi]|uniref:Putative multidrug resistance protein E n=1 Tax=Trypanosoma cruzi TaxID=5693 RepID=A0A2V2VBH7_TRYCR|nr:putative multidrug resistance protein E [Trypanosoma cruzi]
MRRCLRWTGWWMSYGRRTRRAAMSRRRCWWRASAAAARDSTRGRRRGGWSSARWKCGTVRGCRFVLDRVSFRIEPRQKVGVVGRTGSGKSTLLLTLMRMVEICGGDIIVSGRPICAYGLRELRQQFSMIPQDPVLFDGTVQSNLDPFLDSTPAEVWRALELVGCGSVWSWRAAASTAACRRAGRTTAWASGSCCAWRVRCCGGAAASS